MCNSLLPPALNWELNGSSRANLNEGLFGSIGLPTGSTMTRSSAEADRLFSEDWNAHTDSHPSGVSAETGTTQTGTTQTRVSEVTFVPTPLKQKVVIPRIVLRTAEGTHPLRMQSADKAGRFGPAGGMPHPAVPRAQKKSPTYHDLYLRTLTNAHNNKRGNGKPDWVS